MKLAINLVIWILVAAISLFPLLYVTWELGGDLRGNVTIEEKIFIYIFIAYILSIVIAIIFRNTIWTLLLPYLLIICMVGLIATYFISSKAKNDKLHNYTPLSFIQAQEIAINKIDSNSSNKMVITRNKPTAGGWVFYYDSEESAKTNDPTQYGVPGNSPLFVGFDGTSEYIPNPNDPRLKN